MERDSVLARAVAAELDLPCSPVRSVVDHGSVNHVFILGSEQDQWVVRFPKDPLSPDVFAVEAWCAQQAAERGVPTPTVIARGSIHGVPYSAQRFVPGAPRPAQQDSTTWSVLGSYGLIINAIQADASAPDGLFTRFGRDLSHAWSRHLAYNLEQLQRDDPLVEQSIYSREEQSRLADVVRELMNDRIGFGLSHGDLTPRNLILGTSSAAVLIDWGSASFGPVPWTDLVVLDRDARHVAGGTNRPDLHAFLSAMGIDVKSAWPMFARFRLVQALDLVRWAADQRPDRLSGAVKELQEVLTATQYF